MCIHSRRSGRNRNTCPRSSHWPGRSSCRSRMTDWFPELPVAYTSLKTNHMLTDIRELNIFQIKTCGEFLRLAFMSLPEMVTLFTLNTSSFFNMFLDR